MLALSTHDSYFNLHLHVLRCCSLSRCLVAITIQGVAEAEDLGEVNWKLCGKIGIQDSRFSFRMETSQSEHMSDHNPRKYCQAFIKKDSIFFLPGNYNIEYHF